MDNVYFDLDKEEIGMPVKTYAQAIRDVFWHRKWRRDGIRF